CRLEGDVSIGVDLTLLKPAAPLMSASQCAYDGGSGTGRSIVQDASPVPPRETERNHHNQLFLFGSSCPLDLDPIPVDYGPAEVWKQLVPTGCRRCPSAPATRHARSLQRELSGHLRSPCCFRGPAQSRSKRYPGGRLPSSCPCRRS